MIRNDELLQAVIQSPDDDQPRLVYADWLEKHGDPDRADFVRVQCALDKMPERDARKSALQQREKELLERYGWLWAEELGTQISEWVFQRGFIERVQMCLETSSEAILAVLRKAPIRHIRDTSQFCELDGVVDSLPHLDRLTGLEFWGLYAFDDALLKKLLMSPHLANLRTLVLHHDRNGNLANDKVIVDAMNSPYRANLEELAVNVDGSWRGPSRKVLRAIAASPHLRKLRKLTLSNAGDKGNRPEMDVATTRALGESPNLAGLQELDLGQTSFPIEAWDEVLRWPFLRRLRWLRLHYACQVNPPSVMTVAEIAALPAYRTAFERAVAHVDWETEFVDPWSSDRCWKGLSWDQFRRQHLFSMWRYIQRRDYDGLEAAFRADCLRYAGQAAVEAIDALPFASYQEGLRSGLRAAIAVCDRRADARSIYLRMRPDLDWNAAYHISGEAEHVPFAPHEEWSYAGPLAELAAPSLPEAAKVRDEYPASGPLDPGGILHYLLARSVAAFGRAVEQCHAPAPVFFSCMHAVFEMNGNAP